MSQMTLAVVIGSTRPGRIGEAIADWFVGVAERHGSFRPIVLDLAQIDLPMYNEPHHPSLANYVHDHTKQWSTEVARAHAIVFVTPEYNHSFNAATKNAIDYLHSEWRDKSVGFVSYGGVAAGTRAVQALKTVMLAVKAVPTVESVNIPGAAPLVVDGRFSAPQGLEEAAIALLDEIARREKAYMVLRHESA